MKVGKTVKTKEADYTVEAVNKIGEIIPEVWVKEMDGEDERMSKSTKSDLDGFLKTTAIRA